MDQFSLRQEREDAARAWTAADVREDTRALGADLVTARDAARAHVREIDALSAAPCAVALDVRDHKNIARAVGEAEQAVGAIDILVNNAGCNVRKRALDVTWDDWNLVLDTNLRGTFFVAQAAARHMIPRGYGRIVNIGSVTSVFGYAGVGPYAASRGGVRQLTMSLAMMGALTASP